MKSDRIIPILFSAYLVVVGTSADLGNSMLFIESNGEGLVDDKMQYSALGYLPMRNSLNSCISTSSFKCPSWHYCDVGLGSCVCGDTPNENIVCGRNFSAAIMDCTCVTYSMNQSYTELGSCIFNCNHVSRILGDTLYHEVPRSAAKLTKFTCGRYNRQGTLCGSCMDDHYPLAYSFNLTCVPCQHSSMNWVKYAAMAFLPLTVFYFITLFFRINATSSTFFGFVTYSQALSFPIMCRAIYLTAHHAPRLFPVLKLLGAFYGVWNLDIGRTLVNGFCLKADTLAVTALEMVVGIFPLVLILLTYLFVYLYDNNFTPVVSAVKPLRVVFRLPIQTMRIRTSLVDAFSTFFLLSSTKLLNVSFDLLVPVKVYILEPSGNMTMSYRLYFNADVTYFGSRHLPYAIMAITVIICFVIIPFVILICYPFTLCQRLLTCFPHRWHIVLLTFVDTFQGCFKDGTGPGSYDCRWFSVFFVIFRLLLLLIYTATLNILYFAYGTMAIILLCILVVVVEPYKDNVKHVVFSLSFFLYLSCLYSCLLGIQKTSISGSHYTYLLYLLSTVFGSVPLFYIIFLLVRWGIKFRSR